MNWLKKLALQTVFDAGWAPQGMTARKHFILRRGKLWMWGETLGDNEEKALIDSLNEEFQFRQPGSPWEYDTAKGKGYQPTSLYQMRDLFEGGLFGHDENADRFAPWTADTITGTISAEGKIYAKSPTGLPIDPDHPELRKLQLHLGMPLTRPEPWTGLYYHGFTATPERLASILKTGLLSAEAAGVPGHYRAPYDKGLVYITKEWGNARGHACTGSGPKYSVVVAIKSEGIDPAKLEPDFDAAREGYTSVEGDEGEREVLNRTAIRGYRGRIPIGAWDSVQILKNGYNQETTPLLLTLSPSEFVSVIRLYLDWYETMTPEREEYEKLTRGPDTFRTTSDARRISELGPLLRDDPIALTVQARKEEAA